MGFQNRTPSKEEANREKAKSIVMNMSRGRDNSQSPGGTARLRDTRRSLGKIAADEEALQKQLMKIQEEKKKARE